MNTIEGYVVTSGAKKTHEFYTEKKHAELACNISIVAGYDDTKIIKVSSGVNDISRISEENQMLWSANLRLKCEKAKFKYLVEWFVERCEKGEIRSKKTYKEFKEALTEGQA